MAVHLVPVVDIRLSDLIAAPVAPTPGVGRARQLHQAVHQAEQPGEGLHLEEGHLFRLAFSSMALNIIHLGVRGSGYATSITSPVNGFSMLIHPKSRLHHVLSDVR